MEREGRNKEREKASGAQGTDQVADVDVDLSQEVLGLCGWGDVLNNIKYFGKQGFAWGDWRFNCGFHNQAKQAHCYQIGTPRKGGQQHSNRPNKDNVARE